MLKILFYHANYKPPHTLLYASLASLYLKTYIDINFPETAAAIDWILPIQARLEDDELIEICRREKPDLLCTGHYIWNDTFLKDQLKRVKDQLPSNCKIVLGGPSIDAHNNPNFFIENYYASYAVYGPGEHAFADLVNHIVSDKKLIAFNVSNLSWYDATKKQQVVSNYKYVAQSKISPFLHNKEYFRKIVTSEQKKGITVVIPYELTRGCPYSCTFCDWNSGFGNKVTRRKNTYEQEIDLFQELGIQDFFLSDANFGQYDEDIAIVEYMAKKNATENTCFKIDGNFSKLRKDNNLKIYHLLAKGNLLYKHWGFTFSLQDINKKVLKNIDRPDVGWRTHKKMLNELRKSYPDIQSKLQIIIGLPGQNVKTLHESLGKITKLRNARILFFISELLPASPASYDKEYQKKFQFVYSTSERLSSQGFFYRGKFPASCVSFDQKEFVDMMIICSFYTGLTNLREEIDFNNIAISEIVEILMKTENFYKLRENLYNNWVNEDKFYYTINFDGSEQLVPACETEAAGHFWTNTKEFNKILIQNCKKDRYLMKALLNRQSAYIPVAKLIGTLNGEAIINGLKLS
jgi:tRNA A37 methylthiotransferase MiaB